MAALAIQYDGRLGAVAHIPARARHQARRHQRVQPSVQGRDGGAEALSRCGQLQQPAPQHVDAACGGAALATRHCFARFTLQRQRWSCKRPSCWRVHGLRTPQDELVSCRVRCD